MTYPSGTGLSTTYDYFGNSGDERLKQIKNLKGSSVLSQNDYTYNTEGTIATWKQQTDSNTPLQWTEGYDGADQLTSAVQANTAISSPAVRSDSYAYDAAGNATTFNVGGVSRSPSYNALNQLTGSTPSGNRSVGFTGTVSGTSTVTVNGSAATVSGGWFSGLAALTPGVTGTVTVVASDNHGNQKTNKYQVTPPAEATYSPTYDADGNELTNGAGQTYTWDAKNELATITYTGGATSNFTYDALGRRIGIIEKNSGGTVTSTKQFVWDGTSMAEERDGSNTVTKRFYGQGEQIAGSSNYYTRDHLGSVREMCSSTGTITSRMAYDPYGVTTTVSGTTLPTKQYTGMYLHLPSSLYLTRAGSGESTGRPYKSNTGTWLSRDPIGERGGVNVYQYVYNNPIDNLDLLGLYATATAAARAAIDTYNPLSMKANREYGGLICKRKKCADPKDRYYYTHTGPADIAGVNPRIAPCDGDDTSVADWHTHGNYSKTDGTVTDKAHDDYDSDHFSPQDTQDNDARGEDGYLGTPSGSFQHYAVKPPKKP